MQYTENTIEINGTSVNYHKVEHDIYGNPRYVIHFLVLADNYREALNIAHEVGGKKYTARWYGGGIVFTTYNLKDTLSKIIKKETTCKKQTKP